MEHDFLQEKNLIRAAKGGSLKAFEEILFLYEKEIFGYILRMVNHYHDAQDLTQETFLKLYEHIERVDEEKSIRPWIYKIATNTVYDWLRKKKNRKEVFSIDNDANPFETMDTVLPYYTIEKQEKRKEFQEMLSELKPTYRNVLTLFYQEELSYQEIARILNIPINTIKTHIRRAKEALKKKIPHD